MRIATFRRTYLLFLVRKFFKEPHPLPVLKQCAFFPTLMCVVLRSCTAGFCTRQLGSGLHFWINKQTVRTRGCTTWVRLLFIHPNLLSLPLAPKGHFEEQSSRDHKVLSTADLFTINIAFPLIRIHYWHSHDDPAGAANTSGWLLPAKQPPTLCGHGCGLSTALFMGSLYFSTVAAGSDTWAAWVPQLFIIDKEICF